MDFLEQVSEVTHKGNYIDLFVRPSNKVACEMYKKRGSGIFQIVDKYYSSGLQGDTSKEDAFDMRLRLKNASSDKFTAPSTKRIQPRDLKYH